MVWELLIGRLTMPRLGSPIYQCDVTNNADPSRSGSLEIRHPELFGGERTWVKSATPFGGFNSGMIHIPPPGTSVLVMATLDQDLQATYFWFAVTTDPSTSRLEKYDHDVEIQDLPDILFSPSIPEPDAVYKFNGIPEKFIWKSETGHKIELSEKIYNDFGGNLIQEDHILLETKTGKKILIDDGVGPEFSRILLDDGYGNFIKIQTDQDFHTGENSINIESKGNVHITSKSGEIFINVEESSHAPIEIRNYGSSSIDIKCDNQNVNVSAGTNINAYAASSIYAYAASGDVFVTAEKGDIEVDAAKGDVNISASENARIAGTDVFLESSNNINLDAAANVNITASEIHLN
jgi:hypothetical protein